MPWQKGAKRNRHQTNGPSNGQYAWASRCQCRVRIQSKSNARQHKSWHMICITEGLTNLAGLLRHLARF